MSGKLRWLGLGLVTTAGTGVLALTAMMNSAFAFGDDVGLVIGGSGLPIPGSHYVEAADNLFLKNLYPNLDFYQATPDNPFGNGVFTPEGLYPLTGVHTLLFNYPSNPDSTPIPGFPAGSTSVGQGISILDSTIHSNLANGDVSTVFGYSQSATISSYLMQQLTAEHVPQNMVNFVLIGDPSAPNGGLLERFAGYETLGGQTHDLPLTLPSMGLNFDIATPASDYTTSIYSLEYDGFTDFPRYPLDFLSDLNAFLGIADIHGTYLNQDLGLPGGPTPADIANAVLLPGSMNSTTDPCAGCLTNYYMIDTLNGNPITPPLVELLPKPLQDLLGPDLTYLINLGYGDPAFGYSTSPADIATPFGLFPPGVTLHDILSTLATDTAQGFHTLMTDPTAWTSSVADSAATAAGHAAAGAAAATAPTFTEIINAISSAASTAYSTLLPLADIANALFTSVPAYDLSLLTANLGSGDLVDALGLPVAADTALGTLAAGFAFESISHAISQIAADFTSLF